LVVRTTLDLQSSEMQPFTVLNQSEKVLVKKLEKLAQL